MAVDKPRPLAWLFWLGSGAGLFFAVKFTVNSLFPSTKQMPPLTLPSTKEEFINLVSDAIDQVSSQTAPETRAIIIAQAALESGWGKGPQARKGNNLFNLTAGSVWNGPVIEGNDLEYEYGSTKAKKITQRFRLYSSYAESIADFLKFLDYARYAGAKQRLFAGDVVGYLALIGPSPDKSKGNFFTLPLDQYTKHVQSILPTVRKTLGTRYLTP